MVNLLNSPDTKFNFTGGNGRNPRDQPVIKIGKCSSISYRFATVGWGFVRFEMHFDIKHVNEYNNHDSTAPSISLDSEPT